MRLSRSTILHSNTNQKNRLEVSHRSRTLLFESPIFALLGVVSVTMVCGCAENNDATDARLEDGGHESDAERDHSGFYIDDKTILSLLPEEWQKVKQVPLSMTRRSDDMADADTDLGDWEHLDGDIHLAVRDGKGYVSYVGFSGCYDPYVAYAQKAENTYRVLLVKNTYDSFACGNGLYSYHIAVGDSDRDTKIELYRQREPGDAIVKLATTQAENEAVDCVAFTRCDADNPCENENVLPEDNDPINMLPGRLNCTYLDACEGAVCAYTREACVIQCGDTECAQLESYPLQLSCNK